MEDHKYTNEPINLWEAITSCELNHQKFDNDKEPRSYGPRVTREDVAALSNSARFGGQELTVRATEEGWLIKVFSCYDCQDTCSVQIMIPKDCMEPARFVLDRTARIIHVHD